MPPSRGAKKDPFGREDMTLDRAETAMDGLLADPPAAVALAVERMYYTGPPRRRNVRINDDNVSAEYWDGGRWWRRGLRDTVEAMSGFAIGELEFCLDWSDRVPGRVKADFEAYLVSYGSDASVREAAWGQVVDVMSAHRADVRNDETGSS